MPASAAKPPNTAAVEASALSRNFGTLIAVDQVTLAIGQGEIFGLIGPNGAGKSNKGGGLTLECINIS
jgi:ABC-type branched-subunit amino acid transport system ATPase component